ncbi:hypothetical protein, partial [Bifidobacterium breve]|uniref:hypothetical protein n=1 Tax=Bifidobacterium breve TaxID=1685 RepID=UPI0019D36055
APLYLQSHKLPLITCNLRSQNGPLYLQSMELSPNSAVQILQIDPLYLQTIRIKAGLIVIAGILAR